jgi:hypothetical protein
MGSSWEKESSPHSMSIPVSSVVFYMNFESSLPVKGIMSAAE